MSSSMTIAIAAPGAMGSAIGKRLAANGATVRTTLAGRSPASVRRAQEAGLAVVATDDELVEGADLVLSILPAGAATVFAERLVAPLARARHKPVYADCNAISPETVRGIAATIEATDCAFADVGVFGAPPVRDADRSPMFYACGPGAEAFVRVERFGLRVTRLDGPTGVASTLKLIHSGITKGVKILGAAMFSCASEHGLDATLLEQMSDGQPELARWFVKHMPGIWSRAYRSVAEMEELEAFVDQESPVRELCGVMARMYERLERQLEEKGDEYRRLSRTF